MLQYLARQPILDREKATFGYELLYRSGTTNVARFPSSEYAARSTLDDLLTFGIDELARGHCAFMNCSQEVLSQRLVKLLPTSNVVLEILENVRPDEDLLHSCGDLRAAGYTLALDDFVPGPNTLPLVEFVDYIKLDLRLTPLTECREIIRQFGGRVKFVAEKVETHEEYLASKEMGCSFFQGYFFAKPHIFTLRQIPPSHVSYLRLLAATCKPDFDFHGVEEIIKSDVALCYKLLRFLNSAAFGMRSPITSLQQALILLGENAIRRWVCVSAAVSAGKNKPAELIVSALIRARFCEGLANAAKCDSYQAFLVGLFSLMSTLLEMPLETILSHIEIPVAARNALLGKPGKLTLLLQIVCSYMDGDESGMLAICRNMELQAKDVTESYIAALRSVDKVMEME